MADTGLLSDSKTVGLTMGVCGSQGISAVTKVEKLLLAWWSWSPAIASSWPVPRRLNSLVCASPFSPSDNHSPIVPYLLPPAGQTGVSSFWWFCPGSLLGSLPLCGICILFVCWFVLTNTYQHPTPESVTQRNQNLIFQKNLYTVYSNYS